MKLCIVGCERSGTTVLARLLSIGSNYKLLNDPPESWYTYPVIYMKGYGLTLQLWWRIIRHPIVKVPGFATILPYLSTKNLLPFKTIYILRDPRDVLAAIKERISAAYAPLMTDVYWLGIAEPKSLEEAVAWRWRKYLESAIHYQANGGSILFIKYEDFCLSNIETLLLCANYSRIPFSSERVIPHLNKQVSKSWSNKISGPGRWKEDITKNEIQLILDVCGNLMSQFNYFTIE